MKKSLRVEGNGEIGGTESRESDGLLFFIIVE